MKSESLEVTGRVKHRTRAGERLCVCPDRQNPNLWKVQREKKLFRLSTRSQAHATSSDGALTTQLQNKCC